MQQYLSIFGLQVPVAGTSRGTTEPQFAAHRAAGNNYGCDASGNITFIIDPHGRRIDYIYDDRNRLVEVRYPDATRQLFTYNRQGHIAVIEDRSGARTTYGYDALGRPTSVVHPDASVTTLTFDEVHRTCHVHTEACDTRYGYDALGRLLTMERTIGSLTWLTAYRYNSSGQPTQIRYPGSQAWLTYEYDDTQRLQRIITAAGREICTLHYGADAAVHVRFGNGVLTRYRCQLGSSSGDITTCSASAADKPLLSLPYRADAAGRLVQIGATRYRYDAEERLVEMSHDHGEQRRYTYDPAGNRLCEVSAAGTTRYQYDQLGRLVTQQRTQHGQVTHTTYRYDRTGRLIEKKTAAHSTTYAYNGRGQLTAVHQDGRLVARYAYGPEGWRMQKEVDGTMTLYHYDQAGRLLAETDAQGRVRATFIWCGAQCVARLNGALAAADIEYYHADQVSTVHAVTDASGQLVWQARVAPFGDMAPPQAYPYMGKWQDAETGFYCFGNRYYDPEVGRFITPDSYTFAPNDPRVLAHGATDLWGHHQTADPRLRRWLQTPRHQHPYVFCYNNPMTYVDFDGHSAWWFFLTIPLALSWQWTISWLGLSMFFLDVALLIPNLLLGLMKWPVTGSFTGVWQFMDFPDVTASARLGVPWAFVGRGGLFGFDAFAYTIGGFFFVGRGMYATFSGAAPTEKVVIPTDPYEPPSLRLDALYDHETQHVFQYTLSGIFFFISPLILGFYLWDLVLNKGQTNSWFERNAGANSGEVYKTLVEVEADEVWAGEPTLVVGVTDVAVGDAPQSIAFTIGPSVPTGLTSPVVAGASRGEKTRDFNGASVVNGEGFYFRAANPSPPARRAFQVTGAAGGNSEQVTIQVKPVIIDVPATIYICSENPLRLSEKDKKGTYRLDFVTNTSGGSLSGFQYSTGATVGTDRLRLLVKYPGRRTVNAAISDFGTEYEVHQFDINVQDITITASPADVFVGGTSTITINGPENSTVSKTFAVAGSVYDRSSRAYTAGRGPIAANQTDKLTFTFTAGAHSCTKDVTITVKPIVVTAAPASVATGGASTVTVTGGTGPYRYDITTNRSGGTMNATTRTYTAGATAGTDTITVTDANGGRGITTITVT